MGKIAAVLGLMVLCLSARAQKVDSIYFHLYTDSLKKGFYNYINVDGKLSDGSWMPLDSTQILFTSNAGHFRGNDLFIDNLYKGEKITVRATLKSNPSISKETEIYIRKRGFTEPLRTNEEMMQETRRGRRKG
jgi:hypothetical protein